MSLQEPSPHTKGYYWFLFSFQVHYAHLLSGSGWQRTKFIIIYTEGILESIADRFMFYQRGKSINYEEGQLGLFQR